MATSYYNAYSTTSTATTCSWGGYQVKWASSCNVNTDPPYKFFRINKEIEIYGEPMDAIDKLRLSVARRLNPNEKYNFTRRGYE